MSFTAFGTADNLPLSWPAGLRYNPSESRYVYSTSNAFQIAALEHVHVVDIDLPQIGSVPNVMTLTLPIQENLPLESRIYFFYVSQANEDDQLVFQPVTGSGNTINGNAVSYTFVLTGSPELIIVLGVRGNYICQVFGRNNPTVNPSRMAGIQSRLTALASPSVKSAFYTDNPGTNNSVFYNSATGMDAFRPFGDTDISGYFTRNVALPATTGVYGFQCEVAGWYHMNLQFSATYQWDSTSGQNIWGDLAVFNSAGTLVKHFRAADCCQSYYIGNTNYSNLMASQFWDLSEGDIVVFSFSGVSAGVVSAAYVSASMTFVYYGPTITEEAPLMLRSSVEKSNTNPEVFAPLSKSIAGPKAVSIQKQRQSTLAIQKRGPSSSSSSSFQGQPMFTLSDMEKMINQALDSRQMISQPLAVSSPSSSSSASSTVVAPASKKRKLVEETKKA